MARSQVFPDVLRAGLEQARVVLAVIGDGWLSAQDKLGRRRLDVPEDWVALELGTALACRPDVVVIPLLLPGGTLPSMADAAEGALPPALRDLAQLEAATVDHGTWDRDMAPILDRIAELLGVEGVDADTDAPRASGAAEAFLGSPSSGPPRAGVSPPAARPDPGRVTAGAALPSGARRRPCDA